MSRTLNFAPVYHLFRCRRDYNRFRERMGHIKFEATTRGQWIVAWFVF